MRRTTTTVSVAEITWLGAGKTSRFFFYRGCYWRKSPCVSAYHWVSERPARWGDAALNSPREGVGAAQSAVPFGRAHRGWAPCSSPPPAQGATAYPVLRSHVFLSASSATQVPGYLSIGFRHAPTTTAGGCRMSKRRTPHLRRRSLRAQTGSRSPAVAQQCDSERAAALLGNATASQQASRCTDSASAARQSLRAQTGSRSAMRQRASRRTDSASAARQSLATKQRQPRQWEWSWLLPSLGDSERAAALTSCDSEPLHWLYISSS